MAVLERPVLVGAHDLAVRASVGIAVAGAIDRAGEGDGADGAPSPPTLPVTAESLLREADLAMYAAKAAGGGRVAGGSAVATTA
jgi:GGDEF domain-containing protein